MPKFDHFNRIAKQYDRWGSTRDLEPYIRLLRLPSDGYLLDAGGGTGTLSNGLKSFVRHAVVADVSTGMLREAQKKVGILPAMGEAESLPFRAEMFSRILMVDAFHHVADQVETCKELWRLLKPGGVLLIVEPDIRKFMVKLIAIMEKALLMRSHMIRGDKIAGIFTSFRAKVTIEERNNNIYLVVEKKRNQIESDLTDIQGGRNG